MTGYNLPIVAAGDSDALWHACKSGGLFYLVDHGIDSELLEAMIDTSREFFDVEQIEKDRLSIKNSVNHRGYGLLKNYRDWREQIHIGVEAQPGSPINDHSNDLNLQRDADYWRLWGPNQWPTGEFKQITTSYLGKIDALSRRLLTTLAVKLEQPEDFFTARMRDRPYLLMKAISYLPQEHGDGDENQQLQTGVPAHCDWSWLTLLIQDSVGGLEAQDQNGDWQQVTPLPGSIVVNTGELLEIESGGILPANPHRVINTRIDRQRISIPVFINPALDATVYPGQDFAVSQADLSKQTPHIHKVVEPGTKLAPFIFGVSEYERKEQGNWCYRPQCLRAV